MQHNPNHNISKETSLAWLSLFTATSTLLCCALPMILVFMGLGATLAAITSTFPIIVTLSAYKTWLFLGSALLILFSVWIYRSGLKTCPVESSLTSKCRRIRVWNRNILIISSTIWIIGFVATYLILPLRIWLEG